MNQPLETPLVSIVTPSFNQGKFLEATIQSVLNQDYSRIEYIVIDGGSTDDSVDIIRKYEARLAYWVSEQDSGQSDAINKGWLKSSGEIIAYLNSDDTYEPGAVRTAAEFLIDHPEVGMTYGDCYQMDESGRKVGVLPAHPFNLRDLLLGNFIWQQTVFLRKAVLESVGWLDVRLHYAMDYDLWLRTALHFPIVAIPFAFADFRGHASSKSFSNPHAFLQEFMLIIDRTFNDEALPQHFSSLRESAVLRAYLMTILLCYASDQGEIGKTLWSELIARAPSLAEGPDFFVEMIANTIVHNVLTPWSDASPVEPGQWLKSLLDDLPESAWTLRRLEPRILARMHLIYAFLAFRTRDYREVRSEVLRAFRLDPACARNRGAWSILFESMFGAVAAGPSHHTSQVLGTERR